MFYKLHPSISAGVSRHSVKSQNSQYFWLCGSYSFYCDYSSLPLCSGSTRENTWMTLLGCLPIKLFTRAGSVDTIGCRCCSLPSPSSGCVKRSAVVQWFSTHNIWARLEQVIPFQTICESFSWCQGELLNCDQNEFNISLTLENFWLQQG